MNLQPLISVLKSIDQFVEDELLTREVANKERLRWVATVLRQVPSVDLGHYRSKIDITDEEIGKLLLDRAARRGERPQREKIEYITRHGLNF